MAFAGSEPVPFFNRLLTESSIYPPPKGGHQESELEKVQLCRYAAC